MFLSQTISALELQLKYRGIILIMIHGAISDLSALLNRACRYREEISVPCSVQAPAPLSFQTLLLILHGELRLGEVASEPLG